MAIRCPECNKFASLENADPEVESLEIGDPEDGRATVTASVHCLRQCADCSTDMKETTFETEVEVDVPEPEPIPVKTEDGPTDEPHEHELEVEEVGVETTESGGGRYKKNEIGFSLDFTVTCAGCDFTATGTMTDSLQASAWDEMV